MKSFRGSGKYKYTYCKDGKEFTTDGNCTIITNSNFEGCFGYDLDLFEKLNGEVKELDKHIQVGGTKISKVEYMNYPITDVEGGIEFEYGEEFIEGLASCVAIVKDKQQSPLLTGVNIRSKNGKVDIAGTDIHRFEQCTLDMVVDEFDVTIPAADIRKLLKVIEPGSMVASDSKVVFKFGDSKVYSSTIQLKYVDYDMFFAGLGDKITIDSGRLLEILNNAVTLGCPNVTVDNCVKGESILGSIHEEFQGSLGIFNPVYLQYMIQKAGDTCEIEKLPKFIRMKHDKGVHYLAFVY